MSEDEEKLASDYAGALIRNLADALDLKPPEDKADAKLRRCLSTHLSRVGESNREDLCSWVLLECLEKKKVKGTNLDWNEVVKATDRIRHRITRRYSRERCLASEPELVDGNVGDSTSLMDLKSMLRSLPQEDLIIFNLFFLEGTKPSEIAKKLGISASQVYRRRTYIIKKLAGQFRNGDRNYEVDW